MVGGLPLRDWPGHRVAVRVEFALATPILLRAALPFCWRGLDSVRKLSPNMWMLISLGAGRPGSIRSSSPSRPVSFPRPGLRARRRARRDYRKGRPRQRRRQARGPWKPCHDGDAGNSLRGGKGGGHELRAEGKTAMFVAVGGAPAAVAAVADPIKESTERAAWDFFRARQGASGRRPRSGARTAGALSAVVGDSLSPRNGGRQWLI